MQKDAETDGEFHQHVNWGTGFIPKCCYLQLLIFHVLYNESYNVHSMCNIRQ